MRYEKPPVGEEVRVWTRHDNKYHKALLPYYENEYFGTVLKDMKWLSDDQFAIAIDDERMPVRVITLTNVVDMRIQGQDARKFDPNKGTQEVVVAGSKGDEYVVTIKNGVAQSCTCLGFNYRGQCRHLKVAVDKTGKNQDNTSDAEQKPAQQTHSKEGKSMNDLKSNDLGWGTRLALIEHFDLSDDRAKEVFGKTDRELATARELLAADAIRLDTSVDFKKYEGALGGAVKPTSKKKAVTKKAATKKAAKKSTTTKRTTTKRTTSKPTNKAPVTATKPKKTPQKRGRKGDKIINAFKAVPKTPTNAEKFAQKHSVSMAVLRQAKRFDKTGEAGVVKVKKDRATGELRIWREV